MHPMANPTGKHGRKRRHPGEGTIVRRADHWRRESWAVVVPYTDESGRRRKMWRSASSKDEAEAMRAELVRQLNAGISPTALIQTFGEYLDAWMAALTLTPGTLDRYKDHVGKRIRPTLGHFTLARLTAVDIRAAVASWKGSPSTREGTTIVLKAALRDAERDGLLPNSPARHVRLPKRATKPPTVLDVTEARALLVAAKEDRLYPLLVTMLGLGLRRGEALGLRVEAVDLEAGTVTVAHQLRRIPVEFRAEGEGPTRLVAPKAGSYGVLPLPEFVCDALRLRLDVLAAEKAAAKVWAPNDLVFCLPNGNPISFSRLQRWFDDVTVRAKLGHLRLHDLRHSTGAILLAEGEDIRTIQAILRHKSITQTERYTQVLPRVSKGAATRMGAALG